MKRLLAKKGFILYIGTVRKKRIQTDTLNKAQLPAPKKRASGSGRSTIRSHVSDLPFPQESFTVIDSPGLAPDSMFRLCGWSDMMIQFSSIIIIQTHNVVTCCFMRKCQILNEYTVLSSRLDCSAKAQSFTRKFNIPCPSL